MRHYLPTFAKHGERRFNRPTDAYDVMRVRDSWLCAQLADELILKNTRGFSQDALARVWQNHFGRMMAKLGGDSWSASVLFHATQQGLTPNPN